MSNRTNVIIKNNSIFLVAWHKGALPDLKGQCVLATADLKKTQKVFDIPDGSITSIDITSIETSFKW